MSIATTPDQTEIQNSIKSWAKSVDPVDTVRAQETDPDAWKAHWPQLAGLGIFGVAVAEEHGGAGAEIVDLACMLEEATAPSCRQPRADWVTAVAREPGPPWCNGSTQAFGALQSGFESWGRSSPRAARQEPGARPDARRTAAASPVE